MRVDRHTYNAVYMRLDRMRFGDTLQRISEGLWPAGAKSVGRPPREVWRSKDYLVLVYVEGVHERLSVCRAALSADGLRMADGISWDELQRLKSECGRGDCWATEIYPPDEAVVNVANMRHLWLIPEPGYGWKGRP